MTPRRNLPSILEKGILCYNRARYIPHQSVALSSVQKKRRSGGADLHDFVPLYFATHTPMQYLITMGSKRRSKVIDESELVFIEIDAVSIFKSTDIFFTDGNAASYETSFYDHITDLDSLNWDIIRTRNCSSDVYRRKKAAEVLIPDQISPDFFRRIVVYDQKSKTQLKKEITKYAKQLGLKHSDILTIDICIDSSYYYTSCTMGVRFYNPY